MSSWLHTLIALSSIFIAYMVGKYSVEKDFAKKIAKETLDKLEKENMVKYIINKKGEKEYQRIE